MSHSVSTGSRIFKWVYSESPLTLFQVLSSVMPAAATRDESSARDPLLLGEVPAPGLCKDPQPGREDRLPAAARG